MSLVIAIDGPAGAGKSTVGRAVARRLELGYLDTGAMYRGVTFGVLRRGLDPSDTESVARVADGIELSVDDAFFRFPPGHEQDVAVANREVGFGPRYGFGREAKTAV